MLKRYYTTKRYLMSIVYHFIRFLLALSKPQTWEMGSRIVRTGREVYRLDKMAAYVPELAKHANLLRRDVSGRTQTTSVYQYPESQSLTLPTNLCSAQLLSLTFNSPSAKTMRSAFSGHKPLGGTAECRIRPKCRRHRLLSSRVPPRCLVVARTLSPIQHVTRNWLACQEMEAIAETDLDEIRRLQQAGATAPYIVPLGEHCSTPYLKTLATMRRAWIAYHEALKTPSFQAEDPFATMPTESGLQAFLLYIVMTRKGKTGGRLCTSTLKKYLINFSKLRHSRLGKTSDRAICKRITGYINHHLVKRGASQDSMPRPPATAPVIIDVLYYL